LPQVVVGSVFTSVGEVVNGGPLFPIEITEYENSFDANNRLIDAARYLPTAVQPATKPAPQQQVEVVRPKQEVPAERTAEQQLVFTNEVSLYISLVGSYA